ncbi:MAG: hypothetical protein J7449_12195, partial [Thermomicrobium sp.]|uniref:hypothetical protein n=1 Tax=Thermomicrobium sp. TaxID=1969469 RepID=UPI001B0969B4
MHGRLRIKLARGELEGSTVLQHNAHDLVGKAFWRASFNVKRDGDLGAQLPDQVRDHFLGNPTGIATDPIGIKADRAV